MKVHTSIMKVHSTLAQISEEDTSEDSGASGEEMDYNYNSEDYSSALAHMYKVAEKEHSRASGEMKKRFYHKAKCAADATLAQVYKVAEKRHSRALGEMKKRFYHKAECAADAYLYVRAKRLGRTKLEALERCEYVAKSLGVRSAWNFKNARVKQNNYFYVKTIYKPRVPKWKRAREDSK
jgi:hypothetical protein